MNIEKSLSDKYWEEKLIDFNHIQSLSQKKSISEIFSKLLISRGVFEENYDNYFYWITRIILILPIYQILLIIFGILFGEFSYFWRMEKKTLNKIRSIFKSK